MASADARNEREAALSADDVAAYLKAHPDFLVHHPSLLDTLQIPPRQSAAGDHDVVERQQAMRSRVPAPWVDPPLERHPLIDRVVAVGDLGQHAFELVGLDLREEADLAKVHAEQRNVDLGHRL